MIYPRASRVKDVRLFHMDVSEELHLALMHAVPVSMFAFYEMIFWYKYDGSSTALP